MVQEFVTDSTIIVPSDLVKAGGGAIGGVSSGGGGKGDAATFGCLTKCLASLSIKDNYCKNKKYI